jgi:hypothetical protein
MSCSTSRKTAPRWTLLQILFLIGGLSLTLCGGCTTTNDSDIPWNAPQPWEGSPNIPGLPSN